MSRILFENKKVALGFAGAIVVGTALFAGVAGITGDPVEGTRVAEAPADLTQSDSEPRPDAKKRDNSEREEIEFAPDEELIDGASGFDPTPGEGTQDVEDDNGDDERDRKLDERDAREERRDDSDDDQDDDNRSPYNPFADLEEAGFDDGF